MKLQTKLILFIIGILGLLFAGCSTTNNDSIPTNENNAKGNIVFTITDAAANMENINEVQITTSSVEVQNQNQNWVRISDQERTFDLLRLRNQNRAELFANASLNNGNYTQMRFNVEQVTIINSNGTQHDAKLPSNMLRFNNNMEINENSTTAVELDVLVDESLHVTGNGQYILTPVIKVTNTQNATVNVENNGNIRVQGRIVETKNVGMDLQGNVGVNVRVPTNANISISNGQIRVGNPGINSNNNVNIGSNSSIDIIS